MTIQANALWSSRVAGMGSILVVGSANYDLVWRAPRLPAPGETVLGGAFATFPGGKGANQAVAAGKLGADVYFCGCLGHDSFGDELIASLTSAEVKTDFVRRVDTPNGNAAIIVDDQGSNQIVVAPGANALLRPEDVERAIAAVKPDIVLAQLEIPIECIEAASLAPRFILNPAPARELPASILSRCEALIPNETEAALLLPGSSDMKMLLASGIKNLIVTLGSKGAAWYSEHSCVEIPTKQVEAVDTTAAGDVFCGALCALLAEGASYREAIGFANTAAAISVTRHGAQASAPTREEVERLQS